MNDPSEEFWRLFRELQPDVDIVLVPQEPTGPPADSALGPEAAASCAAGASCVTDDLVASCGLSVARRVDEWRRHEDGGFEFSVLVWSVDEASPATALERFQYAVERITAAGWAPVSPPTPVPWLRATRRDINLCVDLSVDDVRLRLEVTTLPLQLQEEPW